MAERSESDGTNGFRDFFRTRERRVVVFLGAMTLLAIAGLSYGEYVQAANSIPDLPVVIDRVCVESQEVINCIETTATGPNPPTYLDWVWSNIIRSLN